MKSMLVLALLAILPLLGCDALGDRLRGPPAAGAYAIPLATDTTVVTTRRVWSSAHDTTISIGFYSGPLTSDGSWMAVTDGRSGDPAVFDLLSKEIRRFPFNDEPYDEGLAMDVVASPDGSRMAFRWLDFLDRDRHLLRVVEIETGESRTLLAPDSSYLKPVAWTPAGDSVFALVWPIQRAGDAEIVLIPTAGGMARQVNTIPQYASVERMSLSPDGRWLLYTLYHPGAQPRRSDIFTIDLLGGGDRPLVEHPASDVPVGWLPGTDVVLFSSDRSGTTDLWSVRVVNGRASAEPRLVRSGFFSSRAVGFGGGALFYTVTTGWNGPAIASMDPQSGALLGGASPPVQDLSTFHGGLAWSPDGETLAAITRASGGITLHSMETGESRVFWIDADFSLYRAQWAADGKALFLRAGEAGSSGNPPTHFLRLDLFTGTTTRQFATGDPGEPLPLSVLFRVTPDGRAVVLLQQQRTVDDGSNGMTLVLRSLEDGSERELHRTSGVIPEFSVSPDGTQLAFIQQAWEESDSLFTMSANRPGLLSDSLYVMNLHGGSGQLRAVAGWDRAVALLGWLPAGNSLVAARLTDDATAEEILRIGLDGTTTVVGISPFPPSRWAPIPGAHRSRLVLSPAGNRLAYQVSGFSEELWRMDGLHELFAGDPKGRQ